MAHPLLPLSSLSADSIRFFCASDGEREWEKDSPPQLTMCHEILAGRERAREEAQKVRTRIERQRSEMTGRCLHLVCLAPFRRVQSLQSLSLSLAPFFLSPSITFPLPGHVALSRARLLLSAWFRICSSYIIFIYLWWKHEFIIFFLSPLSFATHFYIIAASILNLN